MKVQERFLKQFNSAIQLHYSGRTHGRILRMLKDGYGTDAVSARTLSNWIAHFKSMGKEAISREVPFELHLMEEYGLPLEASEYISEMLFRLSTTPSMPLFPSIWDYESGDEWNPTVREIEWWWRVHNMADDFTYRDVYLLASHYAMRELLEKIGGIPVDYSDLNAFMTYKPWRSMDRTEHYRNAIKAEKFKEIGSEDDSTRGIKDAEGNLTVGNHFGLIYTWSQMADKRYLRPYKALMMTMHVSSVLARGLVVEETEEDFYTIKGEMPEEKLEYVFDEEELEDIKEFIKEWTNEY